MRTAQGPPGCQEDAVWEHALHLLHHSPVRQSGPADLNHWITALFSPFPV